MKKLTKRVMAWLMAAVLLLPFNGVSVSAFADGTQTREISVAADNEDTLYLDDSMVQENGSIVITETDCDSIILPKELNAEKVLLQNVSVKELIVESGNDTMVSISGGAIIEMTVIAPQLEEITYEDIRRMTEEGMDPAEAAEAYVAYLNQAETYAKLRPSIVLADNAEVRSLAIAGSISMDVSNGTVADLAVVSEGAVFTTDICGYTGDLTVNQFGTDNHDSRVRLNLKDTQVQTLLATVEKGAVLIVESTSSSVAAAGIAGNESDVYLNIPVTNFVVNQASSQIEINLYANVKNLVVKGSDNYVWLSNYAWVENMENASGNTVGYMGYSSPWANSSSNGSFRPQDPEIPEVPVADRVSREKLVYAVADILGITGTNDGQYSYDDFAAVENNGIIETFVRNGYVTLTADEDNMLFFDPSADATRDFAATVISSVLGIVTPSADADWEDAGEVTDLNAALFLTGYDIVQLFDNCFAPDRPFTKDELVDAVAVILDLGSSTDIDHEISGTVDYAEEVAAVQTAYTVDEAAGIITIPAVQRTATEYVAGSIYVLENADGSQMAVRVTNVTEADGCVTLQYETPSIGEVVSGFDVEGSTTTGGTMTPAEGVTEVPAVATWSRTRSTVEGTEDLFSVRSFAVNMDNVEIYGRLDLNELEYRFTAGADFAAPFISIDEVYVAVDYDFAAEVVTYDGVEREITLYEFTCPLGMGFTASGVISLVVNADGETAAVVELDSTTGVQYRDGGFIRPVYDVNFTADPVVFAGNSEITVNAAPSAQFLGMNLVSVKSETGIGMMAETAVTEDCMDIALYDILSINAKIGPDFMAVETGMDILNATNAVFANKHVEEYMVMDSCSLGGSAYAGLVKDYETGEAITGAKVQILRNGQLLDTRYTNAEGKYEGRRLNVGEYTLRISAAGYVPYEQTVQILNGTVTTLPTQMMVAREGSGEEVLYNCSGKITDATTGLGIEGVEVTVKSVNLFGEGEVIATVLTDADGTFSFEAAEGQYELTTSLDGYVANTKYVTVTGDTSNINLSINPAASGDISVAGGNLRVVLQWGERPRDLDSHLVGTDENGEFHVYYGDMFAANANLDVDDVSSYGPETITITRPASGSAIGTASGSAIGTATGSALSTTYSYYVHDFTNRNSGDSTGLGDSEAYIQLYSGDLLLYTIHVPAGVEGTLWHVFDYDIETSEITFVNEMSYHANASTVGRTSTSYRLTREAAK